MQIAKVKPSNYYALTNVFPRNCQYGHIIGNYNCLSLPQRDSGMQGLRKYGKVMTRIAHLLTGKEH